MVFKSVRVNSQTEYKWNVHDLVPGASLSCKIYGDDHKLDEVQNLLQTHELTESRNEGCLVMSPLGATRCLRISAAERRNLRRI